MNPCNPADGVVNDLAAPKTLAVWVREALPILLPHRALLCGQYIPHAAGYAALQRHAFGLSAEYLNSITVAGHHVRSPILTRLVRTHQPQCFSVGIPDPNIPNEWIASFTRAGWHNLLGLIWVDPADEEGTVTVAGFYDVPKNYLCLPEVIQARVMPLLHTRLNAERADSLIANECAQRLVWTRAQQAIASHVTQGLTTKQIAKTLGKSDQTVKEQLSQMMRKAGVRTRTELAIRLMAYGTETTRVP